MTARLLATRVADRGERPVAGRRSCARCGAYEAYLRTYRGVPSARATRPSSCCSTGSSRAHPVLGHAGRAVPARHRAAQRPRRRHRPGAAAARPDPQPSWSTGRSPRSSTTCPRHMDSVQAATSAASRGDPAALLPDQRRARAGWGRTREPPAHPAHDRLPLRRRGHRVVQRGADAAGRAPTASSCCPRTSRSCRSRRAPQLRRLLGHPGLVVRDAHPAQGAVAHRDEPRRGAAARRTRAPARLGDARRRGRARHRVRRAARADPRAPRRPTRSSTLAATIAARGLDPCDAALAICRAIGERIEYMPGVTGVHSTAREAWAQSKGVCQDITHIALGALRSVGIPARYVSGYLHPKPRRRDRRDGRGRVARLGRVVLRRLARLRPDQPHRHRRPPRDRRPRPRLQRRAAAARRLRGPVRQSKLFVTVEITREA